MTPYEGPEGTVMDEFAAAREERNQGGTSGWWTDVLPNLTDEQSEALMRNAADRGISHPVIAVVLRRWGFTVSASQVGHWRRTHVGR